MQALAAFSRRIFDQKLDDASAETISTPDQYSQNNTHDSILRASSVVVVRESDSVQDAANENANDQYNEHEDRLFMFPPPNFRKRDRQLRVLMSR
jgi:hypothetical protein